jgi:hypothetical protein
MTGYANTTDSIKTVENEAAAAKYWHDMYVTTLKNAQDYAAKVGEDIGRLERELQISQGYGYEKGFLDGAQHQMKSSVYTAPPQRPWVGLTDEEINSWDLPVLPTVAQFARFVETKLRSKNT